MYIEKDCKRGYTEYCDFYEFLVVGTVPALVFPRPHPRILKIFQEVFCMYIEKDCKRGYTEYCRCEDNNGEGSLMDVGVLIMEDGDTYEFHETEKEMAFL